MSHRACRTPQQSKYVSESDLSSRRRHRHKLGQGGGGFCDLQHCTGLEAWYRLGCCMFAWQQLNHTTSNHIKSSFNHASGMSRHSMFSCLFPDPKTPGDRCRHQVEGQRSGGECKLCIDMPSLSYGSWDFSQETIDLENMLWLSL